MLGEQSFKRLSTDNLGFFLFLVSVCGHVHVSVPTEARRTGGGAIGRSDPLALVRLGNPALKGVSGVRVEQRNKGVVYLW